jgi:ADP-ribose pyrophosphatase YjhB (NUDIX family)
VKREYYSEKNAPQPRTILPVVVVAIIDADRRVLLHRRRDGGDWALPGGVMEVGESAAQAGIREVREETGLDVHITGLLGVYSTPEHIVAYDDGAVVQPLAIALIGEQLGGTLAISGESSDAGFFTADEVDTLVMTPAMRLRLHHALTYNGQPFVE